MFQGFEKNLEHQSKWMNVSFKSISTPGPTDLIQQHSDSPKKGSLAIH